jgi:transitional endoplasmic reticulum ATPase
MYPMAPGIEISTPTAADVATAKNNVRPSLDPAQVESLRAFATDR